MTTSASDRTRNPGMRIFVPGATGVIGRRVVPALVGSGHAVTAVGRSLGSLRELEHAGASVLALDLFDRDAVRHAMKGHDAVINLATHVPRAPLGQLFPGAWKEMDHLRKEGAALLADAAAAAGLRLFVQESFAPIYPDCADRWITEDVSPQPIRYNRSVLDAEAAAESFARGDRTGIALRFAFFYGSNDHFTSVVVRSVRRGWFPLPGRPGDFVSMINHEDAASAVVFAMNAPSGIYNVADDDPTTRREFGDALAQILGVRSPKIPPRWLAELAGPLGNLMVRSLRISNAKLKKTTGWTPKYRNAREGMLAALHA